MARITSSSAKERILASHTDEALADNASASTPPAYPHSGAEVLSRKLPPEDREVSGIPEPSSDAHLTHAARGENTERTADDGWAAFLDSRTVPEVTAYMDEHPERAEDIRTAEAARGDSARKGVLDHGVLAT
jgi:hypothetical protein